MLVLVDRLAYSERDMRVSGTSVDTPPKVSRINTSSTSIVAVGGCVNRVRGRVFDHRQHFLVDRPLVQTTVGPLRKHQVQRSIGRLEVIARAKL